MSDCNQLKSEYQICIKDNIFEECNPLKVIYRNCLRNLLNNYNPDISYNKIFNILSQHVVNMDFPLTIQRMRDDLLGIRLYTIVDFNKINGLYSELDINDQNVRPYILNPRINPQLFWLSSNTSNQVGADIFFPVNNNRIQLEYNRFTGTNKGWVCKNKTVGNWYIPVLNKIIPLYCESFKNYFYSQYIERLDFGIDKNDINCEIVENQNDLSGFKFSINLNSTDSLKLIDSCKIGGLKDSILGKFNFIITLDNGNTYKLISDEVDYTSDFRYIYFNDELLPKNKVYNIIFLTENSEIPYNIILENDNVYEPSAMNQESYIKQKELILSRIEHDSFLRGMTEDDVNRALATVGPPYQSAYQLLVKEGQVKARGLEYTSIEIFVQNIIKIDILLSIPDMEFSSMIQDRYAENIDIPNELKQLYKIIGMTDVYANFQMGIQLQHNNFLANKTLKQYLYKNIEEIEQKMDEKLEHIQHIKEFESMDINKLLETFISGNVDKEIIDDICSDYGIKVSYNITGTSPAAGIYISSDSDTLTNLVTRSAGFKIKWRPVFLIPSKYISDIIHKVSFKEEKVTELKEQYKHLHVYYLNQNVNQYKSSVQLETNMKTIDISSYFDKYPDNDIKQYFQQLQQDSSPIKKIWVLTSQEDIEKIIKEISALSIEAKKTNKGGGQWMIQRESPYQIYAYQREHTSPTNSIDSILTEEWFIAPPDKQNAYKSFQDNILDNYENKLEIKIIEQELNQNQKLNLLIKKITNNQAFPYLGEGFLSEPIQFAEKLNLPSYQDIELTVVENLDLQPILNFIKKKNIEPNKENILKILLFYKYLEIHVNKLNYLYNERYLTERRRNLASQKEKQSQLQSDVDIIKDIKAQYGNNQLTINPFRYKIDMDKGYKYQQLAAEHAAALEKGTVLSEAEATGNIPATELNDSNWWMNSGSNTIKFLKTFFLNHGLNETTNKFFKLSKQLPLINLNKSISISNESKSVSNRFYNMPEIYKNLELDIDKVYYKNSTLCDDEISPDLIWTGID